MKQICTNKNSQLYKCGKEAKIALEMYIYSEVICYYNNKDRYGRILGICFVEETELNKTMVQSGNAVAYLKYSKKYLNDQEIAKNKNRGIADVNDSVTRINNDFSDQVAKDKLITKAMDAVKSCIRGKV